MSQNAEYKDIKDASEMIVVKVFEAAGFQVKYEEDNLSFDLIAEKDNSKYIIEVKAARNMYYAGQFIMQVVERLVKAAEKEQGKAVLVVLNQMQDSLKQLIKSFFSVEIVDIKNVLYMVNEDEKLKSEVIAFLNYSVDNIEIEKPNILEKVEYSYKSSIDIDNYIESLKSWNSEEKSYLEYEKICFEVLKILFNSDLALWQKQQASNDGLFRFDLICKIKEGTEQEFWRMSERYFSSKYIVFEFKNYKDRIGQGQVYTTEKYLYRKGLRGVAILISVKGIDENGEKAIRGVLREEGKLIISLSNEDLVKMLETKKRYGQPADYLSEKLDKLLIDLEK